VWPDGPIGSWPWIFRRVMIALPSREEPITVEAIQAPLAAWQQGAKVSGRLARQVPDEPKWRFRQGTCLHAVASMLEDMNQVAEAADIFRRAALCESACQDAPNSLTYHADTGGTWHRLGELKERQGHTEEALKAYQRAIESLRAAANYPNPTAHQSRLRQFLQDEARLLQKLGRNKERH
jgi:tetratricopeptide (TPR) repeat protein